MIVITTMEYLPEHCHECPCQDDERGYCQADKEQRYVYDYRPYWCPLKEIHDNHEDRRQVINRLETALSDLHSFANKNDFICLTQEQVMEIIALLKE